MTATLTEFDALELLCYRSSDRRWLEILGYEYSTKSAAEFRSTEHDIELLLKNLVIRVLNEVGRFPRVERTKGMYLTHQSDGTVICTERHAKDVWRKRSYDSADAAATVLVHHQCCRPELLPDVDLPDPSSTITTPKWERRNKYAH